MSPLTALLIFPPPPILPHDPRIARWGTLMLIVGVAGAVLLMGLGAAALARRHARFKAMAAETARRRAALAAAPPEEPAAPDAWAEAGRRAEAPTAASLDEDALNLDDTRGPGEGPLPPEYTGDEPPPRPPRNPRKPGDPRKPDNPGKPQ